MIWTEEEISTLKNKYGIAKVAEIQKIFLPIRSKEAIRQKARSLGLKSNPHQLKRKYSFDSLTFNKTTNESSYWAGFIAADGSVTDENNKHKKYHLRIKLSSKDKDHIDLFKQFISYTGPIYHKTKYSVLSVYNAKKIINHLRSKFNIVPNKTLILLPPKIKNKQHKYAFIKGYIDGDGCISIERPKRGNIKLRLGLVGTRQMLDWIKKEFDTIDSNFSNASVRKVKGSEIYEYHIAGRKAYSVLKVLNNIPTPFLSRKWDRLKTFEDMK